MTPSGDCQAIYAIVILSEFESQPWSYSGPFLCKAATMQEADALKARGHRPIVVTLGGFEVRVVGDKVAYPSTLQDDHMLRCLLDDRNHPTHWLSVIQDYEAQGDDRVRRLKQLESRNRELESENGELRRRVAELERELEDRRTQSDES